ncbi:MAG: hypothetical protein QOD82_4169, partial [Pseudonocardiales bacterium]|nr:hypothetical protein [Pseudonocardiales bacterium]
VSAAGAALSAVAFGVWLVTTLLSRR